MTDASTRARGRFWLIQLIQFGAALLAFFAAAVIAGRIGAGVPAIVGYALLALAVAAFFVLPNVLRRRWREHDAQGGSVQGPRQS